MSRLWPILLFLLLVSGGAQASEPLYRLMHKGNLNSMIVFIHGLWGDPFATFTASSAGPSWPQMMADDTAEIRSQPALSRYSIAVIGYPAGSTDRMTLPEIATSIRSKLQNEGIFESNIHLHFIAHSLGGLVVKELLLAETARSHQPLITQTHSVFLIASPAHGSPVANIVSLAPKGLVGSLVMDLTTIDLNSHLQSIRNQWSAFQRGRGRHISIFCAYEKKSINSVVVVPLQFADSDCTEPAVAINEDHVSIVKPTSRTSDVYGWVRGRLADINFQLERNRPTAPVNPCQLGVTDIARRQVCLDQDSTTFRDCPTCPVMVRIPNGSIESQNFPAMLSMGKYQVTFDEWDVCVAEGPCAPIHDDGGWGRGRRPVINVSWSDANSFAAWLTQKTKKHYRLPSKAERRLMAAAGSNTRFYWGDDVGQNRANCADCRTAWSGKMTSPVGSFPANAFGLHDMHGNVWEWLYDCADRDLQPKSPRDGRCEKRFISGGSWLVPSSAIEAKFSGDLRATYRGDDLGFRIVREH